MPKQGGPKQEGAAVSNEKVAAKRYLYKNQGLYELVSKVKLWPSRTGVLHGVKSVTPHGDDLVIVTHCGDTFTVHDSKNSRSARWLRNRWFSKPCAKCKVPDWKLEKYNSTVFTSSKRKGGLR